jgi:hypothetical protein
MRKNLSCQKIVGKKETVSFTQSLFDLENVLCLLPILHLNRRDETFNLISKENPKSFTLGNKNSR